MGLRGRIGQIRDSRIERLSGYYDIAENRLAQEECKGFDRIYWISGFNCLTVNQLVCDRAIRIVLKCAMPQCFLYFQAENAGANQATMEEAITDFNVFS